MGKSLVQRMVVLSAIAGLSIASGLGAPDDEVTTIVAQGAVFSAPSFDGALDDAGAAETSGTSDRVDGSAAPAAAAEATVTNGVEGPAADDVESLSSEFFVAVNAAAAELEAAAVAAAPADPIAEPTLVPPTAVPATPVPATPVPPTAVQTPASVPTPPPTAAPVATVAPTAPPVPTIAPPPTAVPAPVVPDHQRRGEAALARMPLSPGSVGFGISFHPARPGFGGLTYPDTRHIEIYVNPDWSDGHLAHVVAHEIGHAVDMARNSRSDHERWRAARGIPQSTRWWADPFTSDFASPGGDFAECFAAWAVGTGATRSQFGSCAGTAALVSELAWS